MGTAEGIWTDPLYLSNAIVETEPWRFGCSRMEEGAGQFMAFNAGPSSLVARPQKTAVGLNVWGILIYSVFFFLKSYSGCSALFGSQKKRLG